MHELGVVFYVVKDVKKVAEENHVEKVSAVTPFHSMPSGVAQRGKRVRVMGRRQGIRNHRRPRKRMVYRPYTQLFLIVPLPLTDSH